MKFLPHKTQDIAPLWDALCEYREKGIIPFHVPGHKQGRGNQELREYLGDTTLAIDLTCMDGLDNICNPMSSLKDAQDLAASAFGAENAFFLVNGTTCGIQGMIMAICKPGDKLIIPRNAHRSAISGLIMSGVQPVYLQPVVDQYFGIAHPITPEQVERALRKHPDAKGVFVINPTYYGVAPDLTKIVEVAHAREIPVIVDEAHGGHFYFHPDLPTAAMAAGADLSAVSTHKLTGSLTQSSLLLHQGTLVDPKRVKTALNLTQTTSPSYILLASLDIARKQMALYGREMLKKVLAQAKWARQELSQLSSYTLLTKECLPASLTSQDIDPTKITLNARNIGLSGHELERILRTNYKIQVELSDLYNVILLLSIGDTEEMISKMVTSLQEIAIKAGGKNRPIRLLKSLPELPEPVISPRDAFYEQVKIIPLAEAEGEISAEMIMAYPPGIPIICPGERFTGEIIDYVRVLKKEGLSLQGTIDPYLEQVRVLARKIVLIHEQQALG